MLVEIIQEFDRARACKKAAEIGEGEDTLTFPDIHRFL